MKLEVSYQNHILAIMSLQTFTIKVHTPTLSELSVFAHRLAPLLQPGDVIALNGNLGAGKTTFVQHLGQALGIQEKVVSPTFVLIHDYITGRFPVIHVDFYRLGPDQAGSLEEEILSIVDAQEALLIAEWAEYADFLEPLTILCLHISENPDQSREIILKTERIQIYDAFR